MAKLNIDPLSGALEAGANAVEKVAGVFTTNAENDAQRSADEQMALLEAYQAEFHHRDNRTWADSLADTFNRLVRPVIVVIIIFIFCIAYVDPARFAEITLALSSIPNGYWVLLSVIIGFYFGGRMQLKSQDFVFRKHQVRAVQALIEAKKEFRKLKMDSDEPDRQTGDAVAKVEAVNQARREQVNDVVALYAETPAQDRPEVLSGLVTVMVREPEERAVKRRRRRLGPRRLK